MNHGRRPAAASPLGEVSRYRVGIESKLANQGSVVPYEPLQKDPIVARDAVRNVVDLDLPAGCWAKDTRTDIGHLAEAQMACVVALLVVAAPGHVDEAALAIWEALHHSDRAVDHVLHGPRHLERSVNHAGMVVIIVDLPDGALGPDPVRDLEDVIHDVGELWIESAHWEVGTQLWSEKLIDGALAHLRG
jgi:hypothetical protein